MKLGTKVFYTDAQGQRWFGFVVSGFDGERCGHWVYFPDRPNLELTSTQRADYSYIGAYSITYAGFGERFGEFLDRLDENQDEDKDRYWLWEDDRKLLNKCIGAPILEGAPFYCINNQSLSLDQDNQPTQSTNSKLPKDKTMSNEKGVWNTIKSDAVQAGYRVAATQTTKGVQTALAKAIQVKAGDNPQMQMLGMVLDSEIGASIIALALGHALTVTPGIKDDKRVAQLAEELRINGYSEAGNMIADLFLDQLKPIIAKALSAIPEEETTETSNLRVVHSEEQEDEEQVEKAPVVKKQLRAAK